MSFTRRLYLPTMLLIAASSSVGPTVLARAIEMGAQPAMAAFIAAIGGLGQLLVNGIAGRLVTRSVRGAFVQSAGMVLLGALVLAFGTELWMVTAGMVAIGGGLALHSVSRLTSVTESCTTRERDRVFVNIAHATRIGLLLGPVSTSLVFAATSSVFWSLVVIAAFATSALLAHFSFPFPRSPAVASAPVNVFRTAIVHRAAVGRISLISVAVAGLRTIKNALIPLVAFNVGLDLGQTSNVIAAATLAGFIVAAIGGKVGASHGVWVQGVVSNAGITVSLFILFFAGTPLWFVIAAVLAEAALSFGAGYMSSVLAQEAPATSPAPLFAVFAVATDSVSYLAPTAVVVLIGVTMLPVGVMAGALWGVAGTGYLIHRQRQLALPARIGQA